MELITEGLKIGMDEEIECHGPARWQSINERERRLVTEANSINLDQNHLLHSYTTQLISSCTY